MNLLGKIILLIRNTVYQKTPSYPWLQKMSEILRNIVSDVEAIFHLGHFFDKPFIDV